MDWELKTLINELSQGRQIVNQLKHLDPSTSCQIYEFLVEKLLSCYDKALSLLNWDALVGDPQPAMGMLGSLHPFAVGGPRSENSDQHDRKDRFHKDVSKKRKTLLQQTKQVQTCFGTGLESPIEDDYSWKKYGQKDILGANFPRAYYRCTYRNVQGCLATKQVQQSDEDPSIFQITYKGRHTCNQAYHSNPALASSKRECPEPNPYSYQLQRLQDRLEQSQETPWNFGTGLGAETVNLGTGEDAFPSFSFPSVPIESPIVESHIFAEPGMENYFNFFADINPPRITSSATSKSNYSSPCQMNNFGMGNDWKNLESNLSEIVSAPTLVTNSPTEHLDFSLNQVELDPNFLLDTSDFLV